MKKLLIVLSVLTIAFAGSAFADYSDSDNNVGVYMDNGDHFADAPAGSTLDLHVVISNLTSPTVAGFEMKLMAYGPMVINTSSIEFPTQFINVGSRFGEIIVGFDIPLLASEGSLDVMTFQAVVSDASTAAGLLIKPIYFSSIPGVPCYLVNGSSGELIEMRQSTGGPDDAVFVVNSETVPVSTQSTSFDSLKSLYR